jgi:hypothetical protein
MKTLNKQARNAGILYLIIIICGLFTEMFVRQSMIVPGAASATATNISASDSLFRLGFVSDLIMVMCDVGVAWLFYLLLKPVNKNLALLAALFRLGQATIIGLNSLNHFSAILLLSGADYLTVFEPEQLNALVMHFLNAHTYGYLISGVFFGISCLILGYLFYRASYLPKFLGIMLISAGIGYLTDCTVNFMWPYWTDASEITLLFTAVITELTLCIWLLVNGLRSGIELKMNEEVISNA